jgi:hypothetical protein
MSRSLLVFLCVCCITGAPISVAHAQEVQVLPSDAIAQSDYIFRGHLVALGKSNVAQLPSDPSLAIVHVEKVIQGGPAFDHQVGQDLTMRLAGGANLTLGTSYIFGVKSWLFADHVAVTEVTHTTAQETGKATIFSGTLEKVLNKGNPTLALFRIGEVATSLGVDPTLSGSKIKVALPPDVSVHAGQRMVLATDSIQTAVVQAAEATPSQDLRLRNEIDAENALQEKRQIKQDASSAQTVVAATVLSVGAAPATLQPSDVDEHAPPTRLARVQVTQVYKGSTPAANVIDVIFVNSSDIRWFDAPKLAAGQSAILFLRHPDSAGIHVSDNSALGVYRKEDVLRPTMSKLVRDALANP